MRDPEDEKPLNKPQKARMSRREFAVRAAFAPLVSGLAAAYFPAAASAAAASAAAAMSPPPLPQSAPSATKLSPESQAEAEARLQAILARRGSRLSDAQKQDVHRLTIQLQQSLDAVRKAPLENGDSPALYLKPLVEREKPPASAKPAVPAKPAAAAAAKKP